MTQIKKIALVNLTFAGLVLNACSTASVRVMPGENGVNKVVVRDIHKEDAEEEAVSAANKYCKEKNKEAVFTQEGTKYTGTMDESTRKTVQKASKAAMVLGGIGGVVSRESAVPGAVLGGAGTVGTIMTSDRDYESTATFKCQ